MSRDDEGGQPERELRASLGEASADVFAAARIVVSGWRRLVLVGAVFAALPMIPWLLGKRTFSSTVEFVPQTTQDPARSSLATLAGQFGVALGGTSSAQSPQFFADLAKSRDLLRSIASDTLALDSASSTQAVLDFLDVDRSMPRAAQIEAAAATLAEDVISTAVDRETGVVRVVVRSPVPQASFWIATQVVAGVNAANLATRRTSAGAERVFISGRLAESQDSLRAAEERLRRFLEANRVVLSPDLTIQRDRLQREILIQQQTVLGLAQALEDAKIREVRDTPALTVIEPPIVPPVPDPFPILVLPVMFVSGVLLAVASLAIRHGFQARVLAGDPNALWLDQRIESFTRRFRMNR